MNNPREYTTVESTLAALAYECHRKYGETSHTKPLEAAMWEQMRTWLTDKVHDGWTPGNLA